MPAPFIVKLEHELAASVGMSRSKFALRFKSLVGPGPFDYLLHWRMHLAVRALRGSNKPIYSVAFGLGYESESAFSNAFKRVMGYSPNSLRMREKALQAENGLPHAAELIQPVYVTIPGIEFKYAYR